MNNIIRQIVFLFMLFNISIAHSQVLPLPQLVKKIENSVFTVYARDQNGKEFSQGSGFVIDSKGICVTNFHVLEGASSGYVQNKDGQKFEISQIIDYDVNRDLVKFQINTNSKVFYALPLSMTKPPKGEEIVCLSTPVGFEQTLSNGIVSAVRETELYGTVIQITAPISHGSSGSPVLNRKGEVLGVSTFGYEDGQNLNFAVSILNLSQLNKNRNITVDAITRNPLETATIKQARRLYMEQNYNEALDILSKEIAKDSTNHLAFFIAAQIFDKLKQTNLAASLIMRALDLKPDDADYNNMGGIAFAHLAYYEREDKERQKQYFNMAKQMYETSLAIEEDASTYGNLANLIDLGCWQYHILPSSAEYDAINYVSKAIELDPNNDMYYTIRAKIKQQLEDYWGCISDCEKAISINPFNYLAYKLRGDTKGYFLKDYKACIKDLETAIELVDDDEQKADIFGIKGLAEQGWINKLLGINENVTDIDLFIQRLKANPNNEQIKGLLKNIFADFNNAYVISGGDTTYSVRFETLKWIISRTSYADIAGTLSTLSGYDYYKQALEYGKKGERNKAVEYYLKALEVNPNFYWSNNNIGNDLRELGNYQDAIPYLEKAIKIEPDNPYAYANLGGCYLGLKEYSQTLKYCQTAINLTPKYNDNLHGRFPYNYGEPYFYTGLAYIALNDIEKAVSNLVEASRLGNEDAKAVLQKIRGKQ